MELKIISKQKGRIEIEFIGQGQTLLNFVKEELVADKNVGAAGYKIEHP